MDLVGQSLDPRLPIDGQSLVPFLEGNGDPRVVYGEYLGEGTVAPLMMIRRGPWKFVICPTDPVQLFNLEEDPRELHNLAISNDATVKEILLRFEEEAKERWDFKRIHAEVLKSQRSRKLCWDALTRGRFQSWDYQPREPASEQYVASLYHVLKNQLIDLVLPGISATAYPWKNLSSALDIRLSMPWVERSLEAT